MFYVNDGLTLFTYQIPTVKYSKFMLGRSLGEKIGKKVPWLMHQHVHNLKC